MTTTTLGDLTARHGFEVLEHLEAEAEVPVLKGLQAQGDLFIIPVKGAKPRTHAPKPIPAEGLAVIRRLAAVTSTGCSPACPVLPCSRS